MFRTLKRSSDRRFSIDVTDCRTSSQVPDIDSRYVFATRLARGSRGQTIPARRLPDSALAEFIEDRFTATDRDVGTALPHLLATSRGHPQRAAFLAHQVWQATGPGGTATVDMEYRLRRGHGSQPSRIRCGRERTGDRPAQTARLLAWKNPLRCRRSPAGTPKGTASKALVAPLDVASPGARTGKILNSSIRFLLHGSRDPDPRP